MNVGEMQRKLSQWSEQDKERKFHGLYDFLYDGIGSDWPMIMSNKMRVVLPQVVMA